MARQFVTEIDYLVIFQIAALVIYTETMDYGHAVFGADVVGHGIWAGAFYVTAGSLGAAATSKRTKGL